MDLQQLISSGILKIGGGGGETKKVWWSVVTTSWWFFDLRVFGSMSKTQQIDLAELSWSKKVKIWALLSL